MIPRRWTVERVDPAPACEKRVAELEAALDAGDWYIRCLEDVQDRRPVRGLDEAKHGWTNAKHAVTKGKGAK